MARRHIPKGLHDDYVDVYKDILLTVKNRTNGEKPRLVVITDLAKDFDDLLAMIVLKELHRLEAIELLAFVANLEPASDRARLGRGALNNLLLPDIPIGVGTNGNGDDKNHKVLDYEFKGSDTFIAPEGTKLENGQELLFRIFSRAKSEGFKITLLTISSLKDIAQFMENHSELLAETLERCVLQGGYSIINGKLVADLAATNNHFAPVEAQKFHDFLFEHKIRSTCFTKVATFATPIYQNLLISMAKTKVAVGEYLRSVQLGQDLYFWECASGPETGRFRPFMDKNWFLKNKTTWYRDHTPDDPVPEGDEIIKWLDKVTAYDCLAAVGAAEDVLNALQVVKPLKLRTDASHSIHQIVGVLPETDPANPKNILQGEEANVNGERFAQVIQALALGSLKSVEQGMPSTKS